MKLSIVVCLGAFAALTQGYVMPSMKMSNGEVTGRRQEVDRRAMVQSTLLGASALGLGLAALPRASKADEIEEGILAPDFVLPSSLGKELSLAELKKSGKYTVLYFFPQVFTSSCTLEAKAFQRDIDEYKKLNAQIIGVSVDPADKQTDFRAQCGLDFVLLSDKGAKVSEAYGSALDIPFLGRFSNRQTYIISPDGQLLKVFTNVESKVKRHSEEVLEALKALQA